MGYTGGTIDGHGVRARELDHSFIGRTFALQLEGYVLYGRIGAIRVFRHHVLVTLADVPGDDLHLFSDQEIFLLPGQEDGGPAEQLNELNGSLARR